VFCAARGKATPIRFKQGKPMLDKELLEILVCPENHMPLREADSRTIARLNALAEAGRLKNRAGRQVDHPLEAGLVRKDNQVLYLIQEGIPVLLVDEAIPLERGMVS
jgi:uncharacterized protein YbaR (Trm112 family)